MNYLRLLTIPVLAALLWGLTACPKKPDTTTVSVEDNGTTPSTTVIDNTQTPPADTNVNVDVTVPADANAPVVVTEETRTKYPDVVTVVEKEVASPAVTDNTVYVADAPAIKVWTTQVVPTNAPADVVYRVRDLNVTNATDTDITADGYVLVTSPAADFKSERKYVTYTFRKDPTSNNWLIYDLAVSRTEPATAEDLGTAGGTGDTGNTGGTGNNGGSTGGASDTGNGNSGSAGGSGSTGGGY
jgi:hypothetical protein